MSDNAKTTVEVNESKRQIIGVAGGSITLHNVTSFDSAGEWLRLQANEGFEQWNY